MPRRGQVKLLTLFGIRVGVDLSWFVILFLTILWLSSPFRSTLHSSDGVAYATTVITVLLFFGSMIVHELGHALVARRQGIEVQGIVLFLFGGITQMSREPATPAEEFKISAAGPAATLAFVLLCLAVDVLLVGTGRLWHAIKLDDTIHITPVLLSLSWLLPMNVLILVFNLVPAYPLDGGRIARALVWRVTGEKARGTRAAARVGQAFAGVLGGVGLWLVLTQGGFSGLWLLALAWLLGQSARGAVAQTAITQRIEGVRVADIMDRHPVAIPAQTPLPAALEEYFLRYGWDWFPAIDEHGRFLGVARQPRVQDTLDRGENWLTVAAVVEGEDAEGWRVREDRPLTELLSSEGLRRFGALMAVDEDGVLRGVVTVEQVRRALASAFGAPAA
jgi:Zn-dependent protease/CBS domain-containing protein